VRTSRARQAIRQWCRRAEKEACMRMGREILDEVFGKEAKPPARVLKALECRDAEELRERLGRGDIPLDALLEAAGRGPLAGLRFHGGHQGLIRPARCCRPLPGDRILGRFEHGKGMVVHQVDCPFASAGAETWVDIQWRPDEGKLYGTLLEVKTRNQRGMLSKVSGAIARCGAEIDDLRIRQLAGAMTTLTILVQVSDRAHLARAMREVRKIDGVVGVRRAMEPEAEEKKREGGWRRALRSMIRMGQD
jgi:GTP pyrophosphokinase/guanosine-3',5'-bis(diphosphate) 3'-pyrophosphohydrolase